jgi:hypothetical protein
MPDPLPLALAIALTLACPAAALLRSLLRATEQRRAA